ncbi:MAG TPA: neutral/alkaline non-lysosomal ceramidase N-terminal domain-containing protein [Chloroflexia bacterium]|nr:neutral/alkaline non-lysosomal ceramidase N-terminal domain-containing protein [Chloroflexia bacterium]
MQDNQANMASWKAGFGAVDITPPPGLKMAGFAARYQPAEGTHDPLRVRALALETGTSSQPLLMLVFDLVGLSQPLVEALRKSLVASYEIDQGRIILSATHTHSGPAILDRGEIGQAEQAYLTELVVMAVNAAGQALDNREPVTLEVGQAQAENAGRNRSRINGPTDPVSGVLAVRSASSGELMGCVINYTCHPTVLGPTNLLYTADYPYYTIQAVSQATGLPPEKIIFTNGACGDINAGHSPKSSINTPAADNRTYEAAAELGGNVGKAAVEALQHAATRLTPALNITNLKVEIEWQPGRWPTPEELERYRDERQAELDQAAANNDVVAITNLTLLKNWAETILEKPLNSPWSPPVFDLNVVRLGELTWVTVPAELFVEYGLAIKERVGVPAWILGYTNGVLGYIPTPDAYERQDYEADLAYRYQGYPAPFSSGTGQLLVEAASRLQSQRT